MQNHAFVATFPPQPTAVLIKKETKKMLSSQMDENLQQQQQ